MGFGTTGSVYSAQTYFRIEKSLRETREVLWKKWYVRYKWLLSNSISDDGIPWMSGYVARRRECETTPRSVWKITIMKLHYSSEISLGKVVNKLRARGYRGTTGKEKKIRLVQPKYLSFVDEFFV